MKKLIHMIIPAVLVLAVLSSCTSNQPQSTTSTTAQPTTTTTQTSQVNERNNVITLDGKQMTLLGPEIKIGQKAPDFRLVAPYERIELYSTAKEVSLSEAQGKFRLISVVPSLDTPVCNLQTQKFEQEAKNFPQVEFYTISMDMPFAQARYCGAQDVSHMQVLSDYLEGSFGLAYGVLIKELRLLSRSIFIVDDKGIVQYLEYVKEITLPPDYDAALATLKKLVGVSSIQTTTPTTTTPIVTPTTKPTTTFTAAQGNQVGNVAPDFTLNDLQGNTITLSQLKGKAVLLNFWATWCPFCQAERPTIQQIYTDWQSKGLVVLTVDIIGSTSSETPANAAAFMQSHNYTFPVLLDVNRDVTKNYGIKFTPTNFLIDKNGIIREIVTGAFSSKAEMEASLNKLLAK